MNSAARPWLPRAATVVARGARRFGGLLLRSVRKWQADRADRLSAALAFYALFSMAPLLVIVIAVVGQAFGPAAVSGEIVAQFSQLIGPDAARQVQVVIENATLAPSGPATTLLAGLMLIVGATAVFGQVKDALNIIWCAPPPHRGRLHRLLRDRLLSLALVLVVSFLLLISLVLSAGLTALGHWAVTVLPGTPLAAASAVEFGVSLLLFTLLFAAIFMVLPDVRISWSEVWVGALATALLFNLGKYLIGLYLGRSNPGSVFGAAGSLAILLVWLYFSAALFFLGAEFTRVYSLRTRSSRPAPPALAAAAVERDDPIRLIGS